MKRAFSLIEILVVTAIIALLAALLFPVFAQAKKNAYTTTCISNLRQYGLSIQLYQNDFEDKLPVGTILKWRNQKGDGTFFPEDSTRDMIRPLKSYGGGDAAFRCPGSLNSWTNFGSSFTATNSSWRTTNYWDIDNFGQLFFRLQTVP